MPEFLSLVPPDEALRILFKALPKAEPKKAFIPSKQAFGRITASAVVSPGPLPAFSRSTVDGYAVRSADTYGASDTLPVYLECAGELPMGKRPQLELEPGKAVLIHTGGMLPVGADAVVMLENSQISAANEVEVYKPVAVGENIILAGEDLKTGQEALAKGVLLGPAEIGGLLALGFLDVEVTVKPRIGILSSGDEVVAPEITPDMGQVRDINSYSLGALVEAHGGVPVYFGIAPDQFDALKMLVEKAFFECDAVIITAGSSASTRDFTADVIAQLGSPGVLVHGVNIKPGKPTILAVCDGKPVIGLPGNPVSALVIANLFVAPVVEHLAGLLEKRIQTVLSARMTLNVPSQAGREDWIPVRITSGPEGFQAEPIFFKSNLIFTLAQADGIVRIPPDATGVNAGEKVDVIPI